MTISSEATICDAMELMIEKRIGSLIVVDRNDNPIGIITENDIFRLTFRHRGNMMEQSIKDNMSTDLILGVLDDDIEFIAEAMTQNNIQHVPIMDENEQLCGVISIRDIVKAKLVISSIPQEKATR